MTSEQELNEKLAKWAGLEWKWNHDLDCHCGAVDDDNSCRSWYTPNGELATRFLYEDIDFTHDLNACFKWLVPEITRKTPAQMLALRLSVSVDYNDTDKLNYVYILRQSRGLFADEYLSSGEADTPTLALCKAIERLIDASAKECGEETDDDDGWRNEGYDRA